MYHNLCSHTRGGATGHSTRQDWLEQEFASFVYLLTWREPHIYTTNKLNKIFNQLLQHFHLKNCTECFLY